MKRAIVVYFAMKNLIFTFIITMVTNGTAHGGRCKAKSYGENRMVCVCDGSYCDNIPPAEKLLRQGQFVQYTSTQMGLRAEPNVFYISDRATPAYSSNLWKVNSSMQYQEMLGFGAALTDSAGINLGMLSPATQKNLLRQYYGPDSIGYTFVRYPIGGTDFSIRFYTHNDGPPDVQLKRFSLAAEDYKFRMPYLKYIRYLDSNSKILALPWSPPDWMIAGRNNKVGYTQLRHIFYQHHANYFVETLNALKKNGFKVWAVSPQNEPGNGYYLYLGINSCGYSPIEQLHFIKNYLCPTLQKNGFEEVLILNNEDQRTTIPQWPETILNDTEGYRCVSGTGVHWYFDHMAPASRLTELHNKFPDKFILYTEASFVPGVNEPAVQLGNWGHLEELCSHMIEVFNNRVVGWIDWNMVLDLTGGPTYLDNNVDAAIIANATADEFYKQPAFYCLAHFSNFVPPGSKCIQVQSTSNQAEAVAFLRPDNIVAIVILNRNDTDQNIMLQTEHGGYMQIKTIAHSLHTVLYRI